MEILIITVLSALNGAVSILNYNKKNYKSAMFNAFVSGFCLENGIFLATNN